MGEVELEMAKNHDSNSDKQAPLSGGRGAGGEAEKNSIPNIPLHAGAESRQFKHARQLRQEMTDAEKVLWEHLRARRFINLKFRRQHPLLEFIADFYCHELKLIVEVDGGYHGEDDVQYYDEERTKELQRYGYSVIRFMNEEVLGDIEEVLIDLKCGKYFKSHLTPTPLLGGEGQGERSKIKDLMKLIFIFERQ